MKKYKFHMKTDLVREECVDLFGYEFSTEDEEEIEEILENDLRNWVIGYVTMWYEEVKDEEEEAHV